MLQSINSKIKELKSDLKSVNYDSSKSMTNHLKIIDDIVDNDQYLSLFFFLLIKNLKGGKVYNK